MNISQTSFVAEISDYTNKIPEGKLAYFRERQRNRLYNFIISKFLDKEKKDGLSRAQLAKRINKRPEQITRWLTSPGNWTLDTISDLMIAISGSEIDFSEKKISDIPRRNFTQLDNLSSNNSKYLSPTASSSLEYKTEIQKHV